MHFCDICTDILYAIPILNYYQVINLYSDYNEKYIGFIFPRKAFLSFGPSKTFDSDPCTFSMTTIGLFKCKVTWAKHSIQKQ